MKIIPKVSINTIGIDSSIHRRLCPSMHSTNRSHDCVTQNLQKSQLWSKPSDKYLSYVTQNLQISKLWRQRSNKYQSCTTYFRYHSYEERKATNIILAYSQDIHISQLGLKKWQILVLRNTEPQLCEQRSDNYQSSVSQNLQI